MKQAGTSLFDSLMHAGGSFASAAASALRLPFTRIAACALAMALVPVAAQAPLDVRVALVIGNSAYTGNALLENPANDARAMSGVLRNLGFNVTVLLDAQRKDMTDAIATIGKTLKDKQGVGMLYYAGHGIQLDWHNYMVPVDAKLVAAGDVARQTVDINLVMDTFKASGARMNIMVLDACRDNPFAGTASGKGLAQQDAPPGTFLAYATAPGNVAEDGDAVTGNGLYTQYLLAELRRPAARIEDVFKRVRFHVRKQSQGRQIPWESTSLEDDFFFNDGVKFTISPQELQRIAAQERAVEEKRLMEIAERARAQQEALAAEQQKRVQAATQAEEQRRLVAEAAAREKQQQLQLQQQQAAARAKEIARLAEEARVQEIAIRVAAEAAAAKKEAKVSPDEARAKNIAEEKRDWDKITETSKADELYAFLQKYPNGYLAEAALFQLDRTEKPKAVAQIGKNGVVPLPAGQARYRVGDVLEYANFNPATGGMLSTTVTERVTAIHGNRVLINGGRTVCDLMGNTIGQRGNISGTTFHKTGTVAYDTPAIQIPSELEVGKTWRSAWTAKFEDGEPYSNAYADYKVVALESVEVPAGTYTAFRIKSNETTFYPLNRMFRVVERTYWVDSATFLIVKTKRITTSGGNQGGAPNNGMALVKFTRRPLPPLKPSVRPGSAAS